MQNRGPIQLSILNHPPKPLDGPAHLHHLFRKHAESPSCAIDHIDRSGRRTQISYPDLDQRATSLARHIARVTAQSCGQRIPIIPVLLPQSPDLVVSLIAISKAGAAFCPLNLDAPPERIRFILQDVSAAVVVTKTQIGAGLPKDLKVDYVYVDVPNDEPNDEPPGTGYDTLVERRESTHLCYCMYTSGSTGVPKGVLLSHSAVTQSLLAHERCIPSFRRFLQVAAPTFDVSVFEIFFTLFRGATVVSCDRDQLLADLPKVIRDLDVDAAELTPTVAGTLLRSRSNVPSLKCLLTIGEMLTKSVVREFGGSRDKKGILHALYGPTEVAIHCTLQPNLDASSKVGNIGRPIDTVSAFILSLPPKADVLPVGLVGELACGGFQLSDGYLNRPEATSEAFIEHENYGRLYRTGDKCRLAPDGTLEMLGRISDGQVKLRGQRIELGEIEEVTSNTKSVQSAAALIIDDNVVVFAFKGSEATTVEDVMHQCKKWLPEFMLPSDIVLLEKLARLPSGKIDRKSLEHDYKRSREAKIFPQGEVSTESLEREACRMASTLVGHQLGPETPLSAAGLDSLKAIRLASQLRRWGANLSALDILQSNNIRSLLPKAKIAAEQKGGSGLEMNPYEEILHELRDQIYQRYDSLDTTEDASDVVALTPLQAAMLAETMADHEAYCNSVELKLNTEKSAIEVQRIFRELAKKNNVLRYGFLATDHPEHPFACVVHDVLPNSQCSIVTEFDYDFNLAGEHGLGNPFRVQLKPNDDSIHALIHIHHALYDGWSWDLLLDDVSRALQDETLPERPQFGNVASYYYSRNLSGERRKPLDFWRTRLEGFRPINFPALTGKRVPSPMTQFIYHSSTISTKKLQQCATNLNVHPQVYLQGALSIILTQYLGSFDIAMGTVNSGRTIPISGIEDIIGPCITTLPLRVHCTGETRVRELLQRLHSENRAIVENGTLPLKSIKEATGIETYQSLFDTLLVWQETIRSYDRPSSLIEELDAQDYVEHNLLLEYEPRHDFLSTKATFKHDIMSYNHTRLLVRQLDSIVQILIDCADLCVNEVSARLLDDEISVVNSPPESSPDFKALSAPVEERAGSQPDLPAIDFAESFTGNTMQSVTWTYAELNKRANRVGHFMVKNGVKPNDAVAICVGKGPALYACILGTLKAGAGYVPLSPDTPIERLAFILRDSKPYLCLSSQQIINHLGPLQQTCAFAVESFDSDALAEDDLALPFVGEHLAYIIYTSGTTGVPKGVAVTQGNLASNLAALSELYPVSQFNAPRLLQSCSQAFDVSVFEIFFSWHTGMCLCSAPRDTIFRDIEHAINKFKVTHLSMTPTVAALVDPDHVPSVGFLVTAGEALTEPVFQKWAGKGLWQGYGPSETTNICSVQTRLKLDDALSAVGSPLRNTSTFVIYSDDESVDFRPLLKGSLGELCFGGDQVFRGYLDPELTARKIVEHPKHGKIYRSGDLGRVNADNTILVAGRIDDQVKIRGQRVELGEISSRLLQSPTLKDCVTISVPFGLSEEQHLVAFFVPYGGEEQCFSTLPLTEELKQIVRSLSHEVNASLPTYMHPAALVPISCVPMTTQSKVDRRRLASAFQQVDCDYISLINNEGQSQTEDGEWSEIQTIIATALSRTIKRPASDIRLHASFYSYGIDSLSAIAFARSLRESQDNSSIDVSTILRHPTAAQLAKALVKTSETTEANEVVVGPLEELFSEGTLAYIRSSLGNIEKVMPVTPLQEAMLSAEDSVGSAAYQNHTVFRVKGDVARLKNAWADVVSRHQILRTVFIPTFEKELAFAQVVLKWIDLPWTVHRSENDDPATLFEDAGIELTSQMDPRTRPFSLTLILHEACKGNSRVTQEEAFI